MIEKGLIRTYVEKSQDRLISNQKDREPEGARTRWTSHENDPRMKKSAHDQDKIVNQIEKVLDPELLKDLRLFI